MTNLLGNLYKGTQSRYGWHMVPQYGPILHRYSDTEELVVGWNTSVLQYVMEHTNVLCLCIKSKRYSNPPKHECYITALCKTSIWPRVSLWRLYCCGSGGQNVREIAAQCLPWWITFVFFYSLYIIEATMYNWSKYPKLYKCLYEDIISSWFNLKKNPLILLPVQTVYWQLGNKIKYLSRKT